MTVRTTNPSRTRTIVGIGAATLLAGAAGLGLTSATAQAEPNFIPAYHWCPGQYYDPGWGPNWEQNACHDDHHRDNDGDFHGNDHRDNDFRRDDRRDDDFRNGPPPQYAAPGNYYTPPGYVGPPPPPGGWQAPPFCLPFVTCPPT